MPGELVLRIWDVQHGACAMLAHRLNGQLGRLAMIDSGCTNDWQPSQHIRGYLGRSRLDYLFITNADQDHMSDLDGLWQRGVEVKVLHRNPHPSVDALRQIKQQGGLSNDIERFLNIHGEFVAPVEEPFNNFMGGITYTGYYNLYPYFQDTNNLSFVVFIKYGNFKILFPGDLEEDGWQVLLDRKDFRDELEGVTILVASHHGRENGYCDELFDYCKPRAIIMSDKAIIHDTQGMTQTYRRRVQENYPYGIFVSTSGIRRRVLTTRKDGWIEFQVLENGDFNVFTEYLG